MHPLDGVFLKLRRADEHLQVINDLMKGFLQRKPYGTITEFVGQGQTRECLLRLKQREPIPPELSLLIGDACNNMRSALDYLLWQLYIIKDPLFTKNVKFPIWDCDCLFKKKAPKDIGGLTDVQRTTIESLQPYKTGNRALSFLRDVNDSDKHRLVQVIFLVGNIKSLQVSADTRNSLIKTPLPKQIGINIVKGTKVENGTILARVPLNSFSRRTQVNVKSKTTVEFAFDGCKTAHGQIIEFAINGMLSECIHAVTLLESEFAHLGISKYKQ